MSKINNTSGINRISLLKYIFGRRCRCRSPHNISFLSAYLKSNENDIDLTTPMFVYFYVFLFGKN